MFRESNCSFAFSVLEFSFGFGVRLGFEIRVLDGRKLESDFFFERCVWSLGKCTKLGFLNLRLS